MTPSENKKGLEDRVRDLEEENRSNLKSRAAMHRQLGDMNNKMDRLLTIQEEKTRTCAEHQTTTKLLELNHKTLAAGLADHKEQTTKALEASGKAADEKIGKIADGQTWAMRFALTSLGAAVIALVGALWTAYHH